MKKFLKLILGIGGCLFYYFLAFELADFGDPWDKMISWVKGDKNSKNQDLSHKKDSKPIKKVNKINRKYTSISNKDNEL